MNEDAFRINGRYFGLWVLGEDGQPRPEPNPVRAGRWRDAHPELWKIAYDELPGGTVSTVFLPVDHQFGDGPPLLFETMVFRPGTFEDCYCERYSTRDEARAGHARVVAEVRTGAISAPPPEADDVPEAFRLAFADDAP